MRYLLVFLIVVGSHPAGAQTMSPAKQDAESLMNQYIGFAELMLAKRGEFSPYGAAMKPNGEIVGVSVDDENFKPSSQEMIGLLNDVFVKAANSGEYKSTALFYDARVRLPDSGVESDAVIVALDHRDDYSVVVFFPYVVLDGQASFGEIFAQDGDNRIFSGP